MKRTLGVVVCTMLAAALFAKDAPMPEWVMNHRSVYPDGEFLAQRGSGKSAEAAQTDAMSQLARYFQTNVSANLSTTMQSIASGTSVNEQTTVVDDVRVTSEVSLFALEHTEPYYYKKEKKWHCVAYIKRTSAWEHYRPQIELVKNTFLGHYDSAAAERDPFMRIARCKTAWDASGALLEKLEYGRIISPKDEATYREERNKVARLPVMMEAAKKECTMFVNVPGDHNRVLTQAVSTALAKCGFTVAKTTAGAIYTASVEIDDGANGSDPLSIMPSVSLKITGRGGNAVYSYETAATEKSVAYTLENAKNKAYPALAKEVEDSLQKDLGATFGL